MEQEVSDRIDDSLIALRRILRATELYERSLAQSAGLTPAQLRVLQIVEAHPPAGITPTALAKKGGVTQATVTALVDKLVQREMVQRLRSETDRRQTDVVIPETGQRAVDTAPDALQQQFVRAFAKLRDWEQAQLVASLERVAAMLNADGFDASPVLATGDIRHSHPEP